MPPIEDLPVSWEEILPVTLGLLCVLLVGLVGFGLLGLRRDSAPQAPPRAHDNVLAALAFLAAFALAAFLAVLLVTFVR